MLRVLDLAASTSLAAGLVTDLRAQTTAAELLADRIYVATWTDEKGEFEAVLPSSDWAFTLQAGRFRQGTLHKAVVVVDSRSERPVQVQLQGP